MTAQSRGQLTGAVAAAVARVLDINPALLRFDTPLVDLGADDVALVLIAEALVESDLVTASHIAGQLPRVVTFADLVDAVGSPA